MTVTARTLSCLVALSLSACALKPASDQTLAQTQSLEDSIRFARAVKVGSLIRLDLSRTDSTLKPQRASSAPPVDFTEQAVFEMTSGGGIRFLSSASKIDLAASEARCEGSGCSRLSVKLTRKGNFPESERLGNEVVIVTHEVKNATCTLSITEPNGSSRLETLSFKSLHLHTTKMGTSTSGRYSLYGENDPVVASSGEVSNFFIRSTYGAPYSLWIDEIVHTRPTTGTTIFKSASSRDFGADGVRWETSTKDITLQASNPNGERVLVGCTYTGT